MMGRPVLVSNIVGVLICTSVTLMKFLLHVFFFFCDSKKNPAYHQWTEIMTNVEVD